MSHDYVFNASQPRPGLLRRRLTQNEPLHLLTAGLLSDTTLNLLPAQISGITADFGHALDSVGSAALPVLGDFITPASQAPAHSRRSTRPCGNGT